MHDTKESRDYLDSSGGRCTCGDCIEWGCSCADTGRHDECLCGRCGDGSEDAHESIRYSLADGAGHD